MTKILEKKSNKLSKIFTLITLAICMGLAFTLADLFSTLIAVGGFSTSTKGTKCASFSLYSICLVSTQTLSQATDLSLLYQKQNAAGYIYMTENSYNVLASAYENESDAQKVKNNLKDAGTESSIFKIDYPELSMDYEVTQEEKTALNNALSSFKNIYKKLYDLSVSLDTSQSTEIQGKLTLSDIMGGLSSTISNFETLFNPRITSNLLELKLSLTETNNLLKSLSSYSSSEYTFSSQVKKTYFEILSVHQQLAKKI